MKHVMLAILPLVGILLLGGCAVSRMVDRGDESLLSGRPRDAVRFYERAATKDPDLLLDQGFTSKLNKARALKAYEDGQRLAAEDRWDEALARFGDALEHDPLLHEARRALKDARQEASRLHHRRALRFADEGRLNDAIRELRKALEIDPENPEARDALDSVEQKKRKNLNHAAELYGEARQLMAARQWQKVGVALDRVLQENPNHVPARVDRHDVHATIRAAEAKADEAETLLDEKKLNRARTRIRQALDAWPAFARARDLLAQADAGLGRAERLYEQAVELGEKGRWDEAVRAGSQSLAVFPYSDDRRAFLRRARGQAADAHARAGDRLLAKGNLDEAEARYARALGFVPGHAKAKEGLAEADVRRGAAAEAAGLWGNALLWYRQAAEHSPEARFAARVRAAHRRITDRVTFSVRTQFRDRADAATSFTRLRSGVLTHLSGAKPDIVRLLGAGDATYKVSIALDEIRVEQELAATEHRVHTYVEYRAVPNPEVPRLDALLRSAERKLARLRRAYHQPCPVCHGTGRIIRPQPRPRPPKREERRPDRKREKPRPPRRDDHRDEGHDDRDHDDRDGGRHDREREQPRRVTCPRCHGTGRWSKVSRTDIQRQERVVDRLRRRLAAAPPTVQRPFEAQWPYVVRRYSKTGIIQVAVRIEDATGRSVARSVDESISFDDKMIDRANPSVGLEPDGLALPDDASIAAALVDRAAPAVASKIVAAVLTDRADRLRARAEQLEAKGDVRAAIERRVDRARVIEAGDPAKGRRLIAELERSIQPDPAPAGPAPELVPEADEAGEARPDVPSLGLHAQGLTAALADRFGTAGRKGVLVSGLIEGSRGAGAGLRPGDVILRFGDRAVDNPAELERLAQGAEYPVAVLVLREGREIELRVR